MSEDWTMAERIICAAIDKKYKYIARDKNGRLRAYTNRPQRSNDHYASFDAWDMSGFITEFKKITWDNPEPIKIMDIVKGKAPAVLDEEEIKYLKNIVMPFHDRVLTIDKIVDNDYCWISIRYKWDYGTDIINLPPFNKKTKMYSGMESNRHYTVEELGLM